MVTMGLLFAGLTVGGIFYMYSQDLPSSDFLANYAPKTISRIYSAEGKVMDEFATERRFFVPIGDIPEQVQQAFISAEDKRFYSHGGYDVEGMIAALRDAIVSRGKDARGASTIPQQVAKNLMLSGERSAERKVKEIILAARLVTTLGKEKILEIYLNEIFLGQNSFGVTAAAQTYFNKTLAELSPGEAAYLAALPKSPSNRHPVRDREAAVFWRNNTLREMYENGYITAAVYEAEAAAPLLTVQNGDYPAHRNVLPPRDYFTDEIRRQLSGTFGEDEFFSGGLSIRATQDPELQKLAAEALREDGPEK